ncbi:MAG: GNAT family N-acetyltransferase [Erysipelotrichaceae bacterium]|nr:GNAT family N-acetyltransferase [Erysipelotrichaceae bacterium]
MIRFAHYQQDDYQRVCDFLIRLYEKSEHHRNWNWARFEWMYGHPLTTVEFLGDMGLWFDGDSIVAAALIDMFLGEAFIGALPEYQTLYPEVLKYAFEHLKDDRGLGVTISDLANEEINAALAQGFFKTDGEEAVYEIELSNAFGIVLPAGFIIETFDAQEHAKEIEWLFWQGFDHGSNYEEFLQNRSETVQKRPHFNKFLCIIARNEKDEIVASASTWYDERTDYAYLEPVCVIPSCRGKGIGKAVVLTALNHARFLGAKKAIVNSDQVFYQRLGFKEKGRYPFYWKKEEKTVNGVIYKLEKLLGKGKGGYSYLAKCDGKEYVLKQIHHEPCEYYQFGNKIEAEKNDYQRLLDAGIRIPKMIDVDTENEIVLKEYIEGDVISDLIDRGESVEAYIPQVREMARLAKEKELNIDYYPTNFVVRDELLYYIDYECNQYMDEWSLDNWGIKHWSPAR